MKSRIGSVLAIAASLMASGAGAATGTNNNDSCDIATAPAATLLLPYFEVDFNSPSTTAQTTLFTVINTSRTPQIARVTLWTDLGYPVLNFNLFLTGYDVQSINLYDVFGPSGTVAGTTSSTRPGERSLPNSDNPHFAHGALHLCATNPGPLPAGILQDVRTAFTTGRIGHTCGGASIGLTHSNAVGYATIDVVKTCDDTFPNTTPYYADLLYDNVLTGDYQQVSPNPIVGNYATGNPLVHIRAVDGLPYTFYDRYTPRATPSMDRRQPLPSVFAARYVQRGADGFNTNFKIWREGITGTNAACTDYAKNAGSPTYLTGSVRFDEHENPTMYGCYVTGYCSGEAALPETSSTSTSSAVLPALSYSGDVGGWMYFNLNNNSRARASQNWVTVTMVAEGRYSVEFDAAALANGCTPP